MNNFDKAIMTTQKEGGGVYVEAQVAIRGEIHTYGQFYSSKSDSPVFARNIPDAVQKFKNFYYPMYLNDLEQE